MMAAFCGFYHGVTAIVHGRDAAEVADDAAGIRREHAPALALEGTARQEILAIARLLQQEPAMAIDFSAASSRSTTGG